jgi:hypothetical protein
MCFVIYLCRLLFLRLLVVYRCEPIVLQDHQFLVSRPPIPEEGLIQADPASATSKAPVADDGQDGDDAKVSLEESGSTSSPPPANSREPSLDKKRNVSTNCFL